MNTKSTKKFVLVREDKSLITHYVGKQKAAAERMAQKLMRSEVYFDEKLVVMAYDVYVAHGYDKLTRKVTNAMTGAIVEENINTPYSCSVASEAYWSM